MTSSSAESIAPVMLAVVLGAVVLAFVGGTSSQSYDLDPPMAGVEPPQADPHHPIQPARTYLQLRQTPRTEATLARSLAALPATERGPEDLEGALDQRAQTRAYHGAPPVIPHPVVQRSASECLACHDEGLSFGSLQAAPIPHTAYTSCTQCHAQAQPDLPWGERSQGLKEDTRAVSLAFSGLEAPRGGPRWTPLAPPAIPHDTFLHERCMSCHGPRGLHALQTPHDERQICEQCHPAQAQLSQRPGGR